MNKYQEALHRVCLSCDEYSMGACEHEHCAVYAPMKELIDKHEKYKWHDLRKNANDLPEVTTKILVVYEFATLYCIGLDWDVSIHCSTATFDKNENDWTIDEHLYSHDCIKTKLTVIKWKYIERFKDE